MTAVARHDGRTLFERAWSHAVREGLLGDERREALLAEGVRGLRRIATVLGTEHLRDDLERAMRAMMGLVNLHLEKVSAGDVAMAARSIVERGLLFHTKGASQSIKRVLAVEEGEDPDELDPVTLRRFDAEVVAHWALLPYAEFAAREREAAERRRRFGAARALRAVLGNTGPDLDPSIAEPYVMTALLILAYAPERAWVQDLRGFEQVLERARRFPERFADLPAGVPEAYRPIVDAIFRESVRPVMEIVLDASIPIHQLVAGSLDGPGARLMERLVFPDSALDEVDAYEAETTSHWAALTGGRADEETLVTVMLAGALGESASLPLTVPAAEGLLRTAIAAGLPDESAVASWLDANAPHAFHEGLLDLWSGFVDEFELQISDETPPSSLRRFAQEWLWVAAPVKAPSARPVAPAVAEAAAPPAKKPLAKKPPAKKAAAKKAAAKKPAAKKPAAKKPAAKKTAAKKPAAKTPAAKKPAARKPAAKTPSSAKKPASR
ncbi:MAG: hypothetical protein WCK28_09535 [Burkholderiales bacterium]